MSNITYLYTEIRKGQQQYTYFILGATGAGVGFAVQKMDGMIISFWSYPIVCALVFWTASFVKGCLYLQWSQNILNANFELLKLQNGIHEQQPHNQEYAQAAIDGTTSAISQNNTKAMSSYTWQHRYLWLGLLSMTIWKILDLLKPIFIDMIQLGFPKL